MKHDHENEINNQSNNRPFQDVLQTRISRRNLFARSDEYVYCSVTNNSRREVADAANPLAPNADGHIIRWRDDDHHIGTTFKWDIFVIAQDTHGTEDSFRDPDGLWADPDGRLFIQTDGAQKDEWNNQMLVADTNIWLFNSSHLH